MNDPGSAPRSCSAAIPADWPVAPGWQPLVQDFFASTAGQAAGLSAGATRCWGHHFSAAPFARWS